MGRIVDFNLWRSLEDIQNSNKVNSKMLLASVYLTSFEILRSSIIDQVHEFFQAGYDKNHGKLYDPEYETEVLELADGKDRLIASAEWLVQMEALNEADV